MNWAGLGFAAGGAAEGIKTGYEISNRRDLLNMQKDYYQNQKDFNSVIGALSSTTDPAELQQIHGLLSAMTKGTISRLSAKYIPQTQPQVGVTAPAPQANMGGLSNYGLESGS